MRKTDASGPLQLSRSTLILLVCGLNLMLFLLAFAFCPPIWATNDDYRMAVILSGAYLGEPSADAVFLRQPLGWMISGLYRIFPTLPVYGIYMELTLYISCCVICHALLDAANRRGRPGTGCVIYLALYILALAKYVILPQFTLTSGYMAVAAAVLVYRLPLSRHRKGTAVLAALLSLVSFLTRAKVFYLLLPVIAAILLWRCLIQRRFCTGYGLYLVLAALCIALCFAADALHWQQEDYAAYKAFNTARSRVYDYGDISFFYDDTAFYLENGIDETLYRQIASRYLDMDSRLTTEVLSTVADRIAEKRTAGQSLPERLLVSCIGVIPSWFESTDGMVAYTAMVVLGLAVLCAGLMLLHPAGSASSAHLLYLLLFAGLVLEGAYFLFIGRLMTRQIDTLLISAAVLGMLCLIDAWPVRTAATASSSLTERLLRRTALIAVSALCLCTVIGAGRELSASHAAAINRNAKLEALQDLAAAHPENFYFYDTQYFISSTDDVFQVYDASRPLNAESLGSWNVGSPAYLQRNKMLGFTTAIEGLTQCDNVYFVAITDPRLAMTRLLTDHYGMTLTQVGTHQAANCTLYIYSTVQK